MKLTTHPKFSAEVKNRSNFFCPPYVPSRHSTLCAGAYLNFTLALLLLSADDSCTVMWNHLLFIESNTLL
jgi:hypothetical protein